MDQWQIVEADLFAAYGAAPAAVTMWAPYRAMILGLVNRPEHSVLARKYLDQKEGGSP